jgi:hypothetical protein
MAEYIRSIKVTVVVDTNKRTIERESNLDSVSDISDAAVSMQEYVEDMLS